MSVVIGVYINLPSVTVEQYRDLDAKIQAAGISEAGLKLHTCFGEGDGLAVFDVWESQESFDAFASQLGKVAQDLGMAMPTPHFVEMVAYDVRQ